MYISRKVYLLRDKVLFSHFFFLRIVHLLHRRTTGIARRGVAIFSSAVSDQLVDRFALLHRRGEIVKTRCQVAHDKG